jgi:hypothetical protein
MEKIFRYSIKTFFFFTITFGLILSFLLRKFYGEKKTLRFNKNCALIENFSKETVSLIKKKFPGYIFLNGVWFDSGADRRRTIFIYCNGHQENTPSLKTFKEFLKISIENSGENQGWDFNPNLFKIIDNGFPENKNFVKILLEKTKGSGIIFEIIEKKPEGGGAKRTI